MITHLPLDVCLKLKDAGFPQEGCEFYRYEGDDGVYCCRTYPLDENLQPLKGRVACPVEQEMKAWVLKEFEKVSTVGVHISDRENLAFCSMSPNSDFTTDKGELATGDSGDLALASLILKLRGRSE